MRSILSLLFSLTLVFLSTISLDAQSKTLDLERFDGLNVSGNIELILIPDSKNFAEIKVEDVDIDKLETRKKGSTLKFNLKNKGLFGLFGGSGKAYIKLHYTDELKKISSSASADITTYDIVRSDDLELRASSGSSIEIEVASVIVDASVSSGADINLVGSIEEQDVNASSGGSYSADIESASAIARASSGGSINLWVTESLKGRASSGGSIDYKGNPRKTDSSSSSGGSVRSRN